MRYSKSECTPRHCSSSSRVRVSDLQRNEAGFALIVIMTILLIIGAIAVGGISLTTKTETLASNAIQRSRSFQAADAANYIAEVKIRELMIQRVSADDVASDGIFNRGTRAPEWWRSIVADGVYAADSDTILGVVSQPRYTIEKVGNYISDGGTGVVNLDVGSGSYGRETVSGREFTLYSVESHGKGSYDTVDTVIETTVVMTY